jgi:hypothetical protein
MRFSRPAHCAVPGLRGTSSGGAPLAARGGGSGVYAQLVQRSCNPRAPPPQSTRPRASRRRASYPQIDAPPSREAVASARGAAIALSAQLFRPNCINALQHRHLDAHSPPSHVTCTWRSAPLAAAVCSARTASAWCSALPCGCSCAAPRRAAARHRACMARGARLRLCWRAARRVAVCTSRQAPAAGAAAAPGGSAGAHLLPLRASRSTSSSGAPLPTLVVGSSVCA